MEFFFLIILGIILMIYSFLSNDTNKELKESGQKAEGIIFDKSTELGGFSHVLSRI